MLFKIKFRNFACFKEWQEIDLVNRSFEDEIDFIPSCSNVLIGSKSVGKSSFIKLLNTAIDYVNNFINAVRPVCSMAQSAVCPPPASILSERATISAAYFALRLLSTAL